MKIGKHGVDPTKRIRRMDEDFRPAGSGLYHSGRARAFQHTDGSRSYPNDSPATLFCLCDNLGRLEWHFIVLFVHHVLLNLIRLDGGKGSQADMKRYMTNPDARGNDLFQQ